MSKDHVPILAELAHAYAKAERKTEALGILHQLLDETAKNFVPHYHLALVYAGLGDNNLAFDHLEQASETKELKLAVWFRREPRFDSLCEGVRYHALLKRMSLL